MNASLGSVTNHLPQIPVREWFASDKEQVANMVVDTDVNNVPGLAERHTAALLRIEPVHSKSAEVAFRVANIGNRKLQIARAAMVEDILEQPETTAPARSDSRRRAFDRSRSPRWPERPFFNHMTLAVYKSRHSRKVIDCC